MEYAIKGNKQVQVHDAADRAKLLASGYNITDAKGRIIEYSPVHSVNHAEYAKLLAENAKLKEEMALMILGDSTGNLKANNKALENIIKDLEAENAKLKAENEALKQAATKAAKK